MNGQDIKRLRREIIDKVRDVEGGFVNDPRDSGGATKSGITQATARKHGFPDVRKLTSDQIYQIYETDYWDDISGDELLMRSYALVYELFDTAVNMGKARAGNFLQRILNVMNQNGRLWPDLKVDNDIGTKTLEALDAFINHRGKESALRVILRALEGMQGSFFVELAERRPKDEAFAYGWVSQRVGNGLALLDKPDPVAADIQTYSENKANQMTENRPPVYQHYPPVASIPDRQGNQIPYWPEQRERFQQDQEHAFALWLKDEADRLRKVNGKSSWKSKLMWAGGTLATSGLSVALARWGFDVSADTLLNLAVVLLSGGGGVVMVVRKFFTKKLLF